MMSRHFFVFHVCFSVNDSVKVIMKTGFPLDHDQSHQLAHCLPGAPAMRQRYPQAESIVATSSGHMTQEVRRPVEREHSQIDVVQLEWKGPRISRPGRLSQRHLDAPNIRPADMPCGERVAAA